MSWHETPSHHKSASRAVRAVWTVIDGEKEKEKKKRFFVVAEITCHVSFVLFTLFASI